MLTKLSQTVFGMLVYFFQLLLGRLEPKLLIRCCVFFFNPGDTHSYLDLFLSRPMWVLWIAQNPRFL